MSLTRSQEKELVEIILPQLSKGTLLMKQMQVTLMKGKFLVARGMMEQAANHFSIVYKWNNGMSRKRLKFED